MNWEPVLEALNQLYEDVDQLAGRLHTLHAARLQCRKGCQACCVEGITVFEVEAENICRHHGDLLAQGRPRPEGACAFLDEAGACRIYEHRPYLCRTQGLPLRWIEDRDGMPVELRDICPLNENEQPIEALPAEQCWTLGPLEARLANLQAAADSRQLRRVPLRGLFCRTRQSCEWPGKTDNLF